MNGILAAGFFQNIVDAFYQAFIEEDRYLFYLDGIKITIVISLLAIILGVVIGLLVAVIKVASANNKKLWILSKICNLYTTVIRATPVIVQLLILSNMVFKSRDSNEVLVAALCFGINSGAYVAEIIRAGLESVDKGQMEAGRSLGLTYIQTMKLIIIPQAIKNILPALGNEFITLIKETSVAGVVAVTDLTKAAQYIGSVTWDALTPLFIAAICYLIMVLGLTKLLEKFERRMAQGDNN